MHGVTERIHVVTYLARSGTTLLRAMMQYCFDIDGYSEQEISLLEQPDRNYRVFLSKRPREIGYTASVLDVDKHLWAVCLVRDPRDSIVSRHRKAPDKYWTNLRLWKEAVQQAQPILDHPRFITVRYEDMVADPDGFQAKLQEKLPFLKATHKFSEFHLLPDISDVVLELVGGRRPVSPKSVGSWRSHKPRIAAQLQMHGSISADLKRFGYESDDSWLKELDGIVPDNQSSHWPESLPWTTRFRHYRRNRSFRRRYMQAAHDRLERIARESRPAD